MNIVIKPAEASAWSDFFVHSFPGGGKSHFILSSYKETPEGRSGPLVIDFDLGGIAETAVSIGLTKKIPVIQPSSEEELFYIIAHYKDVLASVSQAPTFEDYTPTVFAIDTVSSMEDMFMGTPNRESGPGSGMLSRARKRDEMYAPHPSDYRAVMGRSKEVLRRLHEMEIHTIATAHTIKAETLESKKGLNVDEKEKEYAFFPALEGNTRYTGMKLQAFYLYLEQRGGQFIAQTQPKDRGAQARTRFQNKISREVRNPQFWDFVAVARGEKELRMGSAS